MPTTEMIDRRSAAFGVIDDALLQFRGRSLVSGSEVVDCLLDLRAAVELEMRINDPVAPLAS